MKPHRFAALALLGLAVLSAAPAAQKPKKGNYSVAPAETRPGTAAPDFELPTVGGEPFRLSDHAGDEWVLLVFFRGMW